MSYDSYESSVESGDPVELYEFTLGTDTFRYTSDEDDITTAAGTYTAVPISRERIIYETQEKASDRLQVTLPASNAFVSNFVDIVPGKIALLTILRYHRSDPAEEQVTIFKGILNTVRYSEEGKVALLQVMPLTSAQTRAIPRITFSGLCNHMLYDSRCKISETSSTWEKFLPVSAVSSNQITCTGASAFGSDFFAGGFVEFDDDYRQVISQSGDVLTLNVPFAISPLNQTVRVLSGCSHELSVCASKFSNAVNFGGFPYVPGRNIFVDGLD